MRPRRGLWRGERRRIFDGRGGEEFKMMGEIWKWLVGKIRWGDEIWRQILTKMNSMVYTGKQSCWRYRYGMGWNGMIVYSIINHMSMRK